ncbi:hypothetical protein GBAR_LOCUS761 [Geodia barretti]|uniref:Uncharacterized protein n=1 Tax=Geodia barretti TaxID=519541 RepID=A0AA35QTI5_GEOBA|nr:hypothetical protein GBAR_LOCUS761 [Geodia barretti]
MAETELLDGGSTKPPVTGSTPSGPLGSDTPKLPLLLRFPVDGEEHVNIMKRIRSKYRQFGIMLLEDDTGEETDIIITRCRDDIEAINTEIAMKWLQGIGRSPCTWDTLVTVLEDIGLKGLASKIRSNLQ